MKIQAILNQEKFIEALKAEASMHTRLTHTEKTKMVDKARSSIILCINDKVLREVDREKTTNSMWAKIESWYMTKYLAYTL